MSVTLTILGCGDSAGVPAIGNYWGACDPSEPRNRRSRPAIVVRSETTTLLVDTGPDLREQANRANIDKVDAVLYTHVHSDHLHGIDEIRTYNKRQGNTVTPVYGMAGMMAEIKARFDYLFRQSHPLYPAVIEARVIPDDAIGKPMKIGDIEFTPYRQDHGTCESLGYRFGDVAYSTDMVRLSPESLEILKDIRVWIADAAGYKMEKNYVHATLKDIYTLNEIIRAKTVYMTHLPAYIDYKTLSGEVPAGYAPAYDGLEIAIKQG